MNTYTMTTQAQVRRAFWDNHFDVPGVSKKKLKNGDYDATTRCAFVDYIDYLARDAVISPELSQRVTL